MAVAAYATDLTDLYTDSQGTWSLVSSGGGGQNSLTDPETDDYIQGSNSVSRNPFSSSIRGMVNTIGATTVATGDCVWMWVKADVAQALGNQAAGGIQCLIGNSTTAYECYYVAGSDTYAFGGWRCYPIDPDLTGDTQVGTPTGATSVFGVRFNVTGAGPSKGFPFKADAIRHGKFCQVTGGTGADPEATFQGLADYQGAIARQWGQFQESNGTFIMQGGVQLGTSGTAVEFNDSNRAIFVQNTEFVPAAFNRIEVNNTSSIVTISNSSFTALGTLSRGDFEMVDSATITLDSCTFTDMGTFIFDATTNTNDVDNCTFRRCGLVTQGGATFTSCTFDGGRASASVSTADLDDIVDCTFISDGSNHAVELTSIGGGTMGWSGFLSGYDSGTTGEPVTPTSTGNEAIYVNVGSGTLTINVASGAGIPSIRSAGATVNVVAGQVTTTIQCVDIDTGTPLENVNVYLVADAGGPLTEGTVIIDSTTLTDSNGEVSDTRSLAADQPVIGRARRATPAYGTLYKTSPITGTKTATAGLMIVVQMIKDE